MQREGPLREGSESEADAPAARLRSVEKHFRRRFGLSRKRVLHPIDLDVPRGRTLGARRPNGSGKSTLQKLLAGIERPSAGRIEVLGGSLAEGGVRARIGYVPEDSPFPGELRPMAVLELLGSLQGLSWAHVRERGERLLDRVGLAEHRGKNLRGYSRGMLRRFALAQAWLHEPELLLLDEPTAGLDAQGFEVLEDLLAEARARGATVVFSSHLLSDLHAHCDELVVLSEGRLAAEGAPHELLARPGHWRFEVRELTREQLGELEGWVVAQGGSIEGPEPAGRTLFELYQECR